MSTGTEAAVETNVQLPKLSAADFRVYNHMAEAMEYYHNNFRQTWQTLYSAASSGKRPARMSIKQFLATGQQFCQHLHIHHTIEEQQVYPVLAKRMPAFRRELELLTQHKQIENGLDGFQAYLDACSSGERELRLNELKELMDGFGEVLWAHLADEVRALGANHMREYWTVDEMKRMPM